MARPAAPADATSPAADEVADTGLPPAQSVTWAETPPGNGFRPHLPEGRVVAVRTPSPALTSAIVRELDKLGVRAEPLEAGPLNGHTDHYGALVVTTAVDLPTSTADALDDLKRCFFDVQHLALALRRSAERGGAFLLGLQVTAGPESDPRSRRLRAVRGGLAGLLRTAAEEWPEVPTRLVDVDASDLSTDDLAGVVAAEIDAGLDEPTVRYRGGRRYARVLVDAAPVAGAPLRRPVTVATGGARGVTAACLVRWAEVAHPRLAILGRTDVYAPEPDAAQAAHDENGLVQALFADARARGEKVSPADVKRQARAILAAREAKANLAAMERAGAEVLYLPTDVSDPEALGAALDQVRDAFGPIEAVVHGAGVLADKRIEDKTADQLDLVLDTKAGALLQLLDRLDDDPVRTLCFFSSVAGTFGNAGQADYAMANQVLDCVAERAAEGDPELRVRSLAWGPWEGGMVTPELKAHFAKRGVPLISLSGGADLFVAELSDAETPSALRVVGGSLAGSSGAVHVQRLRLDATRLDIVDDHRVQGAPVVPAMFVADLFLEAGRRTLGHRPAGLADLRVLKGLRLPAGPVPKFLDVEIELTPTPAGPRAMLRLVGDKTPRYSATVVDDAAGAVAPAALSASAPPRDLPVYGTSLFHGPRFHLLGRVTAEDAQGLDAEVQGMAAAGWPGEGWLLDAAAADVALQALLLYAERTTGGAFLPTSVRQVVGGAEPLGALSLRLRGEVLGNNQVRADVFLVDESGRCVLALLGAEAHRVPTQPRPAEALAS